MKVFDPEYPLTAEFRSGPRGIKKSYEDWLDQQMMPEGYPVDLQTNVLRFEPKNYQYANRFAREHPETMVLSTWRAASGTPKGANDDGDPLGVSTITFPGHFVLSPGTTLSSSISPTSQTLRVTSTANMRKGPALLVETTGSGDKIWDRYEYVLITGVGTGSTITVGRQFNGSPDARSFPAGRTYLAPMPWDSRNRKPYTDWFFNLSRFCPKDENGRTAMDVLAIDMIEPLREGGPLDLISGLDLASGPLTVNPSNADYNLDGKVDSDAIYRDGVKTFYQRIREVLGPDRVLTTSLDYEYVSEGFINGVNQEGLAQPDDPWEDLTETVNEVLAWRKLSNLPMVSLAFQQHMSREEDLLRVNMQRLLNGYSVCLGLAADIETGSGSEALDAIKRFELYNGDRKEPHWLGKKLSMKRTALMSENLLNNARSAADWDRIIPTLSVRRGTLAVDGDELVLTPNEGNFSGYVTLLLNFQLTTKSDFTVFLEAISDDDQDERKILLPRINVQAESKALRAKLTGKDYLPLTFYVRGAERSSSAKIDFRFQHGGPIRFRQISVHAATDSLACEFENGVVITNPSLEDQDYDLTELFPGRSNFRRISASPPNDASGIPDKYKPQLRQALELNNGQRITNKSVLVPERNAIFLISDSVRSKDPVEVNGFEMLPDNSGSVNGANDRRPTRSPTQRPPTRTPSELKAPEDRPVFNSPDEKPPSEDEPKTVPLVVVGNNLPQPLGLCEGDCDADSDCQGSLICYQRNKRSPSFVVGCEGYAKRGTDFCIDEAVLASNRIGDDNGQNIFDQDIWSSLPLDQEIGLDSISSTNVPDSPRDPIESAPTASTPGRPMSNSSSAPRLGISTIGTELAIGLIAAMLSIGLFLLHRRKSKNKKEFFVAVGDDTVAGEAPPAEKSADMEPAPRSICTLETVQATGGRNIIPVVQVNDNSSFGPMYEV